jgi:flagellar biogenesis protein FliO
LKQGEGRFPIGTSRWSIILAIVAAVTIIPGSLLAQSTPPFDDGRQGISQSTSARNRPVAQPNRPSQQTTPRFSDARPITPSGQHPAANNGGKRKTSSGVPSAWKTLGTLAAIIGLIVVGGRLWKKHGPKLAGGLPNEAIEVLGKRNVDTRQAIVLVRIGSRILVLGSTANGLRTLSEVTDPVEVDYLAGLCHHRDADNSVAQSFRSLFSKQPAFSTQSIDESARNSVDEAAAIPFARPQADEHATVSHQHAISGGAHV